MLPESPQPVQYLACTAAHIVRGSAAGNPEQRQLRITLGAYFDSTVDQALRIQRLHQMRHILSWYQITDICSPTVVDIQALPQLRRVIQQVGWQMQSLDYEWASGGLYGHRRTWPLIRWKYYNDAQKPNLRNVTTYPDICDSLSAGYHTREHHRLWKYIVEHGQHLTDDDIRYAKYDKMWPFISRASPPFKFAHGCMHFDGFPLSALPVGQKMNQWLLAVHCCDPVDELLARGASWVDLLRNPHIDARQYVALLIQSRNGRTRVREHLMLKTGARIHWSIGEALMRCPEFIKGSAVLISYIKRAICEHDFYDTVNHHEFDAADVFALIVFMCDDFLSLQL